MPENINIRILSEDYDGLFSYLIMKGVITHNYSTHEWKLSDYYKEKIPALADYDFFIYDKMLYRDMMSAERMPNIALHKAISVVDLLCKTELLYKETKPYLKKSDICWNCGKEPIIDKKNHNLFQNGKTPICIDCYNRFERITDFDNTDNTNTDNKIRDSILLKLKDDIGKAPMFVYENHLDRINNAKNEISEKDYQDLLDFTVIFFTDDLTKRVADGIAIHEDFLSIPYKNYTYKNIYEEYKSVLRKLKNITNESTINRVTKAENFIDNQWNSSKSCYIATMAYQDIDHPQVQFLRGFRDKYLNTSKAGRYFIKLYYQYSPFLVDKLKYQNSIHLLVKKLLDGLIFILRKISR